MGVSAALIGHSTLESIPLFHFYPGGSAIRLAFRPRRSLPCREGGFEICEWMKGPEAFPEVRLPHGVVEGLARRWGVDVLFLEGFEPWEAAGDVKVEGLPVAARAHGFSLPAADYVLLEDVSELAGAELKRDVARVASWLSSRGTPFELGVYLLEPRLEGLGEVLEVAPLARALHLYVRDPKGGGAAKALYAELKRRVPYVYLHAGIHSELDTYCPRCGAIVLQRHEGALRGHFVREGKCGRCGLEVPISGSLRERTSRTLLKLARGGVAWYNPLMYLSFKG
ncbi:MAG: hypothetical protein N3F67_06240 [Acidilobaceae archaeon]|nr:hypothetical protein [Acidilobaceae archaeon]